MQSVIALRCRSRFSEFKKSIGRAACAAALVWPSLCVAQVPSADLKGLSGEIVGTAASLSVHDDSVAAATRGSEWRFPLPAADVVPVVKFEGQRTTVRRVRKGGAGTAGPIEWTVEGQERRLGTITANSSNGEHLEVALHAEVTGNYRFEVALRVPDAQPLDARATDLATSKKRKFFYPYDWERSFRVRTGGVRDGQSVADVSPIDLISPGFKSGSSYFAVDTWKLTRLDFDSDRDGRGIVVKIPKTLEVNKNFDEVTTDLPLGAGESTSIRLLSAADIKTLSELRFGKPRPVTGRLTFLYNKDWACAEANCNVPVSAYEIYARHLKGAFDAVIIRTYEPSQAIADAFRKNGIDPYYYLFLGAERRSIDNKFLHEELVARDSQGKQYGAPIVASGASWGLYDIRRADVRQELIKRAVAALSKGYKGVFFDGPAFWLASDGRVGGSTRLGSVSWTFARALLLAETKAALAKVDPSARIGILGDRFYDAQAIADFSLKESFGENWISIDPNPEARVVSNSIKINRNWDHISRQYITNSLFIGQKGGNPLFVGLGLDWAKAPANTWYTEIGDAYKIDGEFTPSLDRMGQILRDVSKYSRSPQAVGIASLQPAEATVRSEGVSVLTSNEPVEILFTEPAPVISIGSKKVQVVKSIALTPSEPIIVAERKSSNGWFWSGYGFAYRDPENYIYGDFLFATEPSKNQAGNLTFEVLTDPGALSNKTPLTAIRFATRTVKFHLPRPKSVELRDKLGSRIDVDVQGQGSDEFSLTLPNKAMFERYTIELSYQ